jgi:flagellin
MNTLAVESANGTYQDGTDRVNLNKEITALQSEIDRISTSTNFNQINLLDGSLGISANKELPTIGGVDFTPATTGGTPAVYTAGTAAAAVTGTDNGDKFTVSFTDEDGTAHNNVAVTVTGTAAAGKEAADLAVTALNSNAEISKVFTVSDDATGMLIFTAKNADADVAVTALTQNTTTATDLSPAQTTAGVDGTKTATIAADKFTVYDGTNLKDSVFTVNGKAFALVTDALPADKATALEDSGIKAITVTGTDIAADASAIAAAVSADNEGVAATGSDTDVVITAEQQSHELSLQIGSDNKGDQRVGLAIGDMSSKGLGVDIVSIESQSDARNAITIIKAAINTVSATRADLGALQNRLEHTTNNLSTMSENLTSAESSIRDVDMADEYVQYSKNQILSQAATAMLTQANAQPQNVLSLLKG